MAKTEKRWQLLLVADDGRIIPFKRIKGVAVGVVVLLVLLGLFCAGLAWQLTAEKVRHGRTQDRLSDADRQVTHYKREHELIAAELVLAEARLEKAGLQVPRRQERASQQSAAGPADDASTAGAGTDDGDAAEPAAATAYLPPAVAVTASPEEKASDASAVETPTAEKTTETAPRTVALGDLDMEHDTDKKVLMARFRVNNDGPRSSSVEGQCVVVLKNESMAPDTWQALPDVRLTNGKPDGKRGRSFRISRFIDMEIIAPVKRDPSTFTTATVYVFDPSGAELLAQDFSIDLPGLVHETATEATAQPEGAAASTTASPAPAVDVTDLKMAHDAQKKALTARFRVVNTGPPSEPVAGRCVVVLHDPQMDPQAWLAMPGVDLVNGEPDGARGQAFQIARFRDMEVKAVGQADPSAFTVASVYVFDTSGARLLQKNFPVDLPAPEPGPAEPAVVESAPSAAPQPTGTARIDRRPSPPSPEGGAGATDTPQSAEPLPDQPAVVTPSTVPAGEPPPRDEAEPARRPDSRARF